MNRRNTSRLVGTPVEEGVRFELGETVSLAVRNADHDIAIHVYQQPRFFRDLFSKIPLARGVVRMLSAISRFFSGLRFSQLLNPQSAMRGTPRARRIAKLFQTTPQFLAGLADILLIPAAFLAGLWLIPRLIELLLSAFSGIPHFAVNAVCCAFRIAGLFLSVAVVSRFKLINRLSMYRGAIAKVTNAYEIYGANVTEAEVARSSELTERSDGAFLLIALSIALIGFALVRTEHVWVALAVRIGILVISAAIAGEILHPIENARADTIFARLRSRFTRLQWLFTLEAHPQMIEVALQALHAATENDLSEVIE